MPRHLESSGVPFVVWRGRRKELGLESHWRPSEGEGGGSCISGRSARAACLYLRGGAGGAHGRRAGPREGEREKARARRENCATDWTGAEAGRAGGWGRGCPSGCGGDRRRRTGGDQPAPCFPRPRRSTEPSTRKPSSMESWWCWGESSIPPSLPLSVCV